MSDLQQHTCPECGAPEIDGRDCRLMLADLIGWEQFDPALGAKHFLIVASFNLQHPAQFTDQAIVSLRDAYVQHMDEGLSVGRIRRVHADAYAGRKRVLKAASDRRAALRLWNVTIADVYAGGPTDVADRVANWAQAVRSQLYG